MKKNFLLLLLVALVSFSAIAQEKGSYLTIWGGIGPTGYKYNMTGVNFANPVNQLKLGGQVGIGYSYYFTKHFGISTGIDVAHYRSHGKFLGTFSDYIDDNGNPIPFRLGNYVDNDPFDGHVTNYELRVRTQDWIEQQSGFFAEIPLMLNFQTKFGENEYWGLYFALGAKFQIPFSVKYSIIDGDNSGNKLNVSGFYEERNLELGHYNNPDLSQHGFGQINNPSEVLQDATGDLNFKFNVSAVGEVGFLFSLSRRVDLSLGAFIDYGLLNVNRNREETKAMFTGPTDAEYTDMGENYNVANSIKYGSMITSEYVNDVTTMSYGGKVGIRIKLGKLSEKPQEICEPDTVFIYIVEEEPVVEEEEEEIEIAVVVEDDPEPESKYDNSDLYLLLEPIYFDLDKATLRPESIEILEQKVMVLMKYPEVTLTILGNTCDLGKDPYNYKLGQRRADAAKDYLINKGVDAARIETITQSRFAPEMPNINEFNRTHNRRDDFRPNLPE